jgi:hypothetical protein
MVKYFDTSLSTFVIALVFLERFEQRHPSLRLTSRTVQRLLVVAALTASKIIEDTPYLNSSWSVHSLHSIYLFLLCAGVWWQRKPTARSSAI